jgi:uncharacterized protein involved in type VI secretion and phage assembly
MQRLREIERRLDALVRQTQLGSAEGGSDAAFMKMFNARLKEVKELATRCNWVCTTPKPQTRLPNMCIVVQNTGTMEAYVWFDNSAGGWLKVSVNEHRNKPINLDKTERVSDVFALERVLQQQGFMC